MHTNPAKEPSAGFKEYQHAVVGVSEPEFVLGSDQRGKRLEIDNMGRSNTIVAEINERVVVLSCFGDFTQYDANAVSLYLSEDGDMQ